MHLYPPKDQRWDDLPSMNTVLCDHLSSYDSEMARSMLHSRRWSVYRMASRVGSRAISCCTGHSYLSSTPNAKNIDGAIDGSFPRTDTHPNTMLVHPTGIVIEVYTGCMLLVTTVYKEPMVLPLGHHPSLLPDTFCSKPSYVDCLP